MIKNLKQGGVLIRDLYKFYVHTKCFFFFIFLCYLVCHERFWKAMFTFQLDTNLMLYTSNEKNQKYQQFCSKSKKLVNCL